MKYEKKLVAILNEKIEVSSLMNALAQMSLGLGTTIVNKEELKLFNYVDGDGNSHPNLSELPFIILKAKNSNHIKALRDIIVERQINFIDFPNFVKLIGTFDDPSKSKEFKGENIEYYGLVVYDSWDSVTEITKKFSLWK